MTFEIATPWVTSLFLGSALSVLGYLALKAVRRPEPVPVRVRVDDRPARDPRGHAPDDGRSCF